MNSNSFTTRGAIRNVALLGNHLPRHCGIATFTTDLTDALHARFPDLGTCVVAMNDRGKEYDYPERVRFEVAESDLGSYHRAADFLNVNDADVLSVQHEYGIFGGKAGSHLLTLLGELRMPIVTTLHTVLAEPNDEQRMVMDQLCALSDRLVVMSAQAVELLARVHAVPTSKIDLIPHGIPVLPNAAHSKSKLGVQGRPVVLTFGLLSQDKGIEYVIDALPAIAARFPKIVYVVLGATHPHVRESDGEAYRLMLQGRGHRLGVDDNLVFHDRFVSHAELVQFLSAADIYVTPYLNPQQITSGTLAFATGAGKPVISTPYAYARELLADGRGVLVPWRDSAAIAKAVIDVLDDDGRRLDLERRAAEFGKTMGWPVVAAAYVQSFQRAAAHHRGDRPVFRASTVATRHTALPDVNLAHLRAMTDDTGLLQHAEWNVPRYEEGYCTDDNARALLLLSLIEDARIETPAVVRTLATRYLAFVRHALSRTTGRFRNFMSYDRSWTETAGSEDSHGRTLWALGTVLGRSKDPGRWALANQLFDRAIRVSLDFTSPRAWAYTLLGIQECLRVIAKHEDAIEVRRVLAERLLVLFQTASSGADWPWFEDRLTYANARLPQALMASGAAMQRGDMIATGVRSLDWLRTTQRTKDGLFAPIGTEGFFLRGGEKAEFDHQPLEACGMVSACLEAHRLTGQASWTAAARTAFDWFLGHNHLDQWVYDTATGGCRDGLHRERRNENQGAEATVSFLTALLEIRLATRPVESQTFRREDLGIAKRF